ncbi:hypothetical protein ASZ90_004815 [hydrocarbon metagenome]|uniref:Uncharacterized protein n=1 Tax=hydrocarbon metagenome TaxID=938273 RepID=A0A0W8FX55_9ZZZZ
MPVSLEGKSLDIGIKMEKNELFRLNILYEISLGHGIS